MVVVPTLSTRPARRRDTASKMTAPWKLAKDQSPEAQRKLDETLYTAAEALRVVCVLVSPVLPHSARAIWKQLGFADPLDEIRPRYCFEVSCQASVPQAIRSFLESSDFEDTIEPYRESAVPPLLARSRTPV